jgi:tetratricopeptide (TPR) repeat protein
MLIDNDFFDSDEFKETLSTYENAVSSGVPSFLDAEELTDIADYYTFMGKERNAALAIESALEMYPGAAAPLAFMAREALNNNDIAEAKHYASQITDKSEREYVFIKAEILIALDKVEQADNILKKRFDEGVEDSKEDFILDASNIFLDYGVFDKAMQWLERSTWKHSSEYEELKAHTLIGLCKYDDAIGILNKLIDQAPYSKKYWIAMATAQFLGEHFDEAISSCEYALAIDPHDEDGLLLKANSLFKKANYAEAMKFYQRYAECDTADKELVELNLGSCLVNLERTDEAISHLQEALRLSTPDSPQLDVVYEELAFAYSAKHCAKEALSYIEQARELAGDRVDMDILYGHILLENGRQKDAFATFSKVIKEHGDPYVMLKIIVSLYENQYVEAAYQMSKKMFEIGGEKQDFGYSYIALFCHDLKKDDEFLHYLKIATERNPQEAKHVVGGLFPESIAPSDYYSYISEKLGRK